MNKYFIIVLKSCQDKLQEYAMKYMEYLFKKLMMAFIRDFKQFKGQTISIILCPSPNHITFV